MHSHIFVKGARVNNLKNIDVDIPRDKLVVLTGLSGSGKSSAGVRHALCRGTAALCGVPQLLRPHVPGPDGEARRGLYRRALTRHLLSTRRPPAKSPVHRGHGDRDLRLPAPSLGPGGHPHCPNCGKEIKQQTVDQIIDQVTALPEGTRIQVMAPVIRGRRGARQGFRGRPEVGLCPLPGGWHRL